MRDTKGNQAQHLLLKRATNCPEDGADKRRKSVAVKKKISLHKVIINCRFITNDPQPTIFHKCLRPRSRAH
jgi:hypothetical protein